MTEERLFQKTVEFLVLRSHYSTHFNMHGARRITGTVNLKEQVELMMKTTVYKKGSQCRREGHRKQFETWNSILWFLNLCYL